MRTGHIMIKDSSESANVRSQANQPQHCEVTVDISLVSVQLSKQHKRSKEMLQGFLCDAYRRKSVPVRNSRTTDPVLSCVPGVTECGTCAY